MSDWTHILATIDVNTYHKDSDIENFVRDKMKNAPPITGSEKNADVFYNALSGYNYSIGRDCDRCKYTVDSEEYCNSPEDYDCPIGHYQTRVAITVVGDLRDRSLNQTKAEFNNFIKYIKNECEFDIAQKTFKIYT